MADLVITAANVLSSEGGSTRNATAGEALTAGKVVYSDPDTSKYKLADCDSATAAARLPDGIALNAAGVDQPVRVHRKGPIVIGAALTPGLAYYLSPTAGGICPIADVQAGDYPVFLGFAISATVLDLDIKAAGVAL